MHMVQGHLRYILLNKQRIFNVIHTYIRNFIHKIKDHLQSLLIHMSILRLKIK